VSWPVVVHSDSPEATKRVAGRLAAVCRSGDIVLLIGDLGAGKTAFAQGFAAALGVEGPVTSPTFTLVRQYDCPGGGDIETLLHADIYRTGSLDEVTDLALAELVEERAVALVEWGDLAAPALGRSALDVHIQVPEAVSPETPGTGASEQRIITLHGRGEWADRLAAVTAVLSGEPSSAQAAR
jgi:tRNA threonylcarbamoyladenosine biosynthesis protein TsaE